MARPVFQLTRRHGVLALQTAVTIALLWLVFRAFDWRAFAAVIRGVPPLFFIAAFFAVVAGQLLYAWRWQVVLAGMGFHLPYREVLRQYLMGLFFGNLMPTAVGGDAAKVYYLGRKIGYVEVGASVFVDRFLGFLWLSVLGAGLAWAVGAPSAILALNRNLLTALAAVFVTVLALLWMFPVERLIPSWSKSGALGGVTMRLEQFGRHVREGGCRVPTLAVAGLVVISYITLLAFAYREYFAAAGVVPSFFEVMNALISMSVFVNLPISVNGIGLREQLHYLLFESVGVPKEVSVSLALLFFGYQLAVSMAGYLLWMRLQPEMATPPRA